MQWIGAYNPAQYVSDKTYVGKAISDIGKQVADYGPQFVSAISAAKKVGATSEAIDNELNKTVAGINNELGTDIKLPARLPQEDDEKYLTRVHPFLSSALSSVPPEKIKALETLVNSATISKTGEALKEPIANAKAQGYLGTAIQGGEPVYGDAIPVTNPYENKNINTASDTIGMSPETSGLKSFNNVTDLREGESRIQSPMVSQGVSPLQSGAGILNMPKLSDQTNMDVYETKQETPIEVPSAPVFQPTQEAIDVAAAAKQLSDMLTDGLISRDAAMTQLSTIKANAAKASKEAEDNVVDKIFKEYTSNPDRPTAARNAVGDYTQVINTIATKEKQYKKFADMIVKKGPTDPKVIAAGEALGLPVDKNAVNTAITVMENKRKSFEDKASIFSARAEALEAKEKEDAEYKGSILDLRQQALDAKEADYERRATTLSQKDAASISKSWWDTLRKNIETKYTIVDNSGFSPVRYVPQEVKDRIFKDPESIAAEAAKFGMSAMPSEATQYQPVDLGGTAVVKGTGWGDEDPAQGEDIPTGAMIGPELPPDQIKARELFNPKTKDPPPTEVVSNSDLLKQASQFNTAPANSTKNQTEFNNSPEIVTMPEQIPEKAYASEEEALADNHKKGDVVYLIHPTTKQIVQYTL